MNVKEKLMELLRKPIFRHELADPVEAAADYLIANGVTVQEWISVEDRLPEPGEIVLAVLKAPLDRLNAPYQERTLLLWRTSWSHGKWERPFGAETVNYDGRVLCWMPLPEPPKEG